MNRLDGKVALISGAARGIGAETARLMVEAGAKVAIGDVLDERGRETARGLGEAALYVHLDVTSEADWQAAIDAVLGRWERLDILVNNAGLFLGKDIETATLEEWHRLSAVNLTGVFLGTKLALSALREAAKTSPEGSVIVNLASTAGLVGSTQDPLYSMTKGGVTLFTNGATFAPELVVVHIGRVLCGERQCWINSFRDGGHCIHSSAARRPNKPLRRQSAGKWRKADAMPPKMIGISRIGIAPWAYRHSGENSVASAD
jgi:NAD(P)-dependent dehydrogenase (short-subunit alcohol dehydrogenase family)